MIYQVASSQEGPEGAGPVPESAPPIATDLLVLSAEELLGFRAGDHAVCEKVFKALWPRLYRTAYRLLPDKAEAEEAAQEGFVRAWRARTSFHGDNANSVAAWIITIVRRTALDTLRRRKRAPEPFPAAPATPEAVLEARETCRDVRSALETLEPADRAAIVLFEIEELPQSEIASLMQLTVGAVKTRLSRARRRFREAYTRLTAEKFVPTMATVDAGRHES